MRRWLPRLFIPLIACLAGGCIEFEEQTMSYRYDAAANELRIFQDYRGIFGADAEGDPAAPLTGEELGQLKEVLAGQHTFFFENWIFEYDRESIKDSRAKLKDPEARKESGIADADIPRVEKLLDLLLAHVHVANGPFYLDADGKLCGVQSVSVVKCKEIIAALNACAPIFLKSQAEEESTTPADRKAIAKFNESDDTTMLRLDGNALSLRWPSSRASYEKSFGEKMEDPEQIEEMRAAGIGIAWADDVVTFSLGKKDDRITTLTLSSSETPYTPNAVAPARALHVVKEHFDTKEAAETFLLREGAGD